MTRSGFLLATMAAVVACTAPLQAQGPDVQTLARDGLPRWAQGVVATPELAGRYLLDVARNPFYLTGDFDADGRQDIAIAVRDRATNKRGIALVRRVAPHPVVLGAGTPFGNGGDDFRWLDLWRVELRADNPDLPAGRGDVLWVERYESASASIHWDGRAWLWTQFGD